VLELGAGYCDFINEVKAEKKIAIDQWPDMTKYADESVECLVGDVTDLSDIAESSLDFVFASNIFEHIGQKDLSLCLSQLKHKMCPGGLLVILQPNFKRCYKDYFDDYTHVSIWTDVGLTDFLIANGFAIDQCYPGFLPLSIKSHFPVHPLLIRAYLVSPIKPMAKQMLIIARNSK
jgi:SAM-dependent methyltransferase